MFKKIALLVLLASGVNLYAAGDETQTPEQPGSAPASTADQSTARDETQTPEQPGSAPASTAEPAEETGNSTPAEQPAASNEKKDEEKKGFMDSVKSAAVTAKDATVKHGFGIHTTDAKFNDQRTKVAASTINTLSRTALVAQLVRAGYYAARGQKAKAKDILTHKATIAAAAGTALGGILSTKMVQDYLEKETKTEKKN